jgi:hypothetical protein
MSQPLADEQQWAVDRILYKTKGFFRFSEESDDFLGCYIAWSGRAPWSKMNSSDYSLDELAFGVFNGDGKTDVIVLDRP